MISYITLLMRPSQATVRVIIVGHETYMNAALAVLAYIYVGYLFLHSIAATECI